MNRTGKRKGIGSTENLAKQRSKKLLRTKRQEKANKMHGRCET